MREQLSNFLEQELFFPCFIILLNTRLSRLSEDKNILKEINFGVYGKYDLDTLEYDYGVGNFNMKSHMNEMNISSNYKEDLYKTFYYIFSYMGDDEYIEIQEYILDKDFENKVKNRLQGTDQCRTISEIFFNQEDLIFLELPKYLGLLYLTIHLAEIGNFLKQIDIDLENKREAFYYHMLSFVDASFYHTDHKVSYYHLLEAEKIYPEFSQIYALKVRTLYFLGFNYYKIHEQSEARRCMLQESNPVYKRIQDNIKLSHYYNFNNKGIFIFELALYLHCEDWKGVEFFLKNYGRRKEFINAQRITIFLWLGKFFLRKGFYKQAQHYLYTEINNGKHKFSVYKARFIFSIISQNIELFDIEKKIILEEQKYIFDSGETKDFLNNIYMDNNIILPKIKNSAQDLLLENIDIELLQKSEKGKWEEIFLLTPNRENGK